MYLVRTEFIVHLGRAAEFEAGVGKLGDARKGMPGYMGQTLLRSYSYLNRYVGTSRWQTVEAAWDFTKSDVLANYAKNASSEVATVTRQEGYESVFEVDAEGAEGGATPSACEVLVDWSLNPGAVSDFESSRKEFFELRKKHSKGFVSSRLRRSGGIPTRYLALNIYATVEESRTANIPAEVQKFARAHPYTLYAAAPPVMEAYHVVHRK